MADDKPNLTKVERAVASRARDAFTRLAGLSFGDKLADELVDHYSKRKAKP